MHISPVRYIKIRKDHRCDWCNGWLKQGTVVPSWWCADDGIAATIRMHVECYRAAARDGDCFEFDPGDNTFGCGCGFTAGCECGWDQECACGATRNACRQNKDKCCPACTHNVPGSGTL